MGGLGTIGETAEMRGRDMRGKFFPLSKYNAVCGEIQWHYDNSNQHETDMTRRMYFYNGQNSSAQIALQGRPHKRGPKQLLLLTLRFGASPSTFFSVHQCTRTASSLGLATGSCFCLWSSFRLRFWSHRQLQDTA